MEDRYSTPRPPARGRVLRSQAVFFCVLPTALLGLTYFLLVEFTLKESAGQPLRVGWLRWGGIGLAGLAILLALALGWILADRLRRPLRALLRVADGGTGRNGGNGGLDPSIMLSAADADLRRLILRVHTLAQQNRAGAEALKEQARLQSDLEEISDRIAAIMQGTQWPVLASGTGSAEGARLAAAIDRLVLRLRERAESVEERLGDLEGRLGECSSDAGMADGVGAALRDLERLGTVWTLEMEIARRHAPTMPGELGMKLRSFQVAMGNLRQAVQPNGKRAGGPDDVRSEVALLRKEIHDWLRPGESLGLTNDSASRGDGKDD